MDVDEFRKRQEADLQRHQSGGEHVVRRRPFHERYAHLAQSEESKDYYNNNDRNDDAIATDSEADEEIQSPETLHRHSAPAAAAEEGEEA
jgi:hypothetical protein